MRILSVGTFQKISNTCLHRHWALEKVADVVDKVDTVTESGITFWYRVAYHLFQYHLPVKLPENCSENKRIKELVDTNFYDVVWIDKGVTIDASTLQYIKNNSPKTVIISYSPDNMAMRHNQSQQYLKCVPLYDYIFTNKSYILDDMAELGAKDIRFVNNSFESTFHYQRELSDLDYINLGGDVGFVGMWEAERCESILYLADHGVNVRVFGDSKWQQYRDYSENLKIENHGLYSEDYAKSFKAFKICLCFLRKMNFDQQTTRSVEIPACGGFMLAERTDEHLAMFKEGEEAAYFSSNEELLEKCKYYLSNNDKRVEIAQRGVLRCASSDYSNEGMIRMALGIVNDCL